MAKPREQDLDERVRREIEKDPPRMPTKIVPTKSEYKELKEAADRDARKR